MNENEEHKEFLGKWKNKSMKKILDYFRVKEYFKIIHDEIKNNIKNVIFWWLVLFLGISLRFLRH